MKEKITALADKLIKIKSTKENAKELERVLFTASEKLTGFSISKFKNRGNPSLICSNTSQTPGKIKVILNAHLDVVPGKDFQFRPKVLGDRLYGRGASDMKGAAAVEILVFKELANKLKYPLGLQLVTDEEVGGFDCTKYQIEKGVSADFVIAGEPTNLCIGNKAKGIIWAKVVAKGKAAHGAYPWNGVNSVKILNNALDKLWRVFPIPSKAVWQTTVNVGRVITENETFNKVPDRSEAWLDIRYIPEDKNTILTKLQKILPKEVELVKILHEPEHFTSGNNEYIKKLRASGIKVLGKTPLVIVRHGASDVRHFNKVGCDGVEFGPVGEGLHSDNEWVSIKSLENYYKVLMDFLLSI